jgi:hypothetical protein
MAELTFETENGPVTITVQVHGVATVTEKKEDDDG